MKKQRLGGGGGRKGEKGRLNEKGSFSKARGKDFIRRVPTGTVGRNEQSRRHQRRGGIKGPYLSIYFGTCKKCGGGEEAAYMSQEGGKRKKQKFIAKLLRASDLSSGRRNVAYKSRG